MKKHIPNMITCLNLLSGCIACVMALNNNCLWAFILIIIASVFDFFDGFAARLLKAYSSIGKELDSLADVVSFGVAPGMIIYVFLRDTLFSSYSSPFFVNIALLAFLIPVFSALRLAKFNVDDRQTSSFVGLPVPADALFWGSLIYMLSYLNVSPLFKIIGVILCIFHFSYLMISEIPMFSLKFKNYGWKGNEARYILIAVTIALFVIFNLSGISVIIIVYILMSLLIKDKPFLFRAKKRMEKKIYALFDLDGVVIDTEPQYEIIWKAIGEKYRPDIENIEGLEHTVKGTILPDILSAYFSHLSEEELSQLIEMHDEFERNMTYPEVPGAIAFIRSLKKAGIPTGLVTSSGDEKVTAVSEQYHFDELFDTVVTAQRITEGKPNPMCYLLAAEDLGAKASDCFVFEDSFAGIQAGAAAGMKVIGLSTTNPEEAIRDKVFQVIPDFRGFTPKKLLVTK